MRHSKFWLKCAVAVAVLLMSGLLAPAASATVVGSGGNCAKIGATKVVKGVLFSCVKNSESLKVWKKVLCAQGGICVVGDTGPGGGTVFYAATSKFTSTGSDCGTVCRYLEAAPTDIAAGKSDWCSDRTTRLNIVATGIGTGMSNTIIARTTCTSGAIQQAADYKNNGKSDWHLPSKDELSLLQKNKSSIGGLSTGFYWSSSERNDDFGNVFFQEFSGGAQPVSGKGGKFYVRPVRAF